MVMVCSIIVHFTEPKIGKYVDPGISILSAALLLYLKYPNSKLYLVIKRKSTSMCKVILISNIKIKYSKRKCLHFSEGIVYDSSSDDARSYEH